MNLITGATRTTMKSIDIKSFSDLLRSGMGSPLTLLYVLIHSSVPGLIARPHRVGLWNALFEFYLNLIEIRC